jgi:hypothetical protein
MMRSFYFAACIVMASSLAVAQTTVQAVTGTQVLVGPTLTPVVPSTAVGAANGVAGLDATGNVLASELGNVSGSATAVPSYATTYLNQQSSTGWTGCNTPPLGCAGGSIGTSTITMGVTSPLGVANAVELTATGTLPGTWSSTTTYAQDTASTAVQVNYGGNNWRSLKPSNIGNTPASGSTYWSAVGGYNALMYKHLNTCPIAGNCGAISQMAWDATIEFPTSNANMNAFEIDPDLYSGNEVDTAGQGATGYEYFGSFQCLFNASANDSLGNPIGHTWRIWNMGYNPPYGQWIDTRYPCNLYNMSGQKIVLAATFGINTINHTYTYENFSVNGVNVFTNLGATFSAAPYTAGAENFNLQTQIDNLYEATPPSNSVYVDKIDLEVY